MVSQDALTTPTPPEKMVPQSVVNQIVGSAKADAADRARREAAEQYQTEIAQLKSGSMGGMQQVDPEAIYQQIKERFEADNAKAQEQAQQADYEKHVNDIAGKFLGKYEQGKNLYDDFEAVTADFDPRAFPQLVFLTAELDNTAEVMYELSKNPGKLANINALAEKSPKMAQKQLANLSESIKANQAAVQGNQEANSPLPRLKSSATAGADSGKSTIRDYRQMDYLRG